MRLLLVEDDLMIGEDLQKALRKGGDVVNWVQDAEMAQLTLELETYDLIILDLGLPGKSGFDLLVQVRTGGNDIPVLILTARDALADKVKGFDSGADDYLLKPFALEELEARIRSLIRRRIGQAGNENGILCHGRIALNPKTHETFFNKHRITLSAKEFMLLHTLFKTPNAILSKAQLEENLYGWNEEITSNAIEVHVSQIRKKMYPDVIKTIRYVGYILGNET